ncbi:hypothetical protein F2Q68_00004411 [Brassica cretica]|uniref:Uncharacterized protein n=2 Tax=Brassica cretica TaxID=69181 RepID=A0ABQ7BY81_BRACR|nr:hypothetical protein F2Q68_00004411 [Brassica cretica]KAF3544365.1 hypothetical protein DY000_02006441 [Brassica cretica]
MSAREHDDFQRIVVALKTIWARVSTCRCSSMESLRATSPSATGPSRQLKDDFDETTMRPLMRISPHISIQLTPLTDNSH